MWISGVTGGLLIGVTIDVFPSGYTKWRQADFCILDFNCLYLIL